MSPFLFFSVVFFPSFLSPFYQNLKKKMSAEGKVEKKEGAVEHINIKVVSNVSVL
jgi:hypothetical protein